jgi:hypothetical protein
MMFITPFGLAKRTATPPVYTTARAGAAFFVAGRQGRRGPVDPGRAGAYPRAAQPATETRDVTWKLALLALALVAGWLLLFRWRRKPPVGRTPPRPAAALERCRRCGVYRLPGGSCACRPPG